MEKKWTEVWCMDPNKYKSGVYTSNPVEGFNQTPFVEKQALDQALKDLEDAKAEVERLREALVDLVLDVQDYAEEKSSIALAMSMERARQTLRGDENL